MDFLVKNEELSFLSEEPILKDYLIFYFSEEWYKIRDIYVLISNSSVKDYKIKLTKNYIKIPNKFKDNKLLSIKVIGDDGLDIIETNSTIGRRA